MFEKVKKKHEKEILKKIFEEREKVGKSDAHKRTGVVNQRLRKELERIAKPIFEPRGIKNPRPGYMLPKVDGRAIKLGAEREYVYRSPFMESKVGSDIVTVKYSRRKWERLRQEHGNGDKRVTVANRTRARVRGTTALCCVFRL